MIWTPIADMIEAMFDNGADLKSVLLAVRTIEERDGERDASRFVTVTKDEKAAIRAKRYRAKRKQNQPLAKANDVAKADDESVTQERDASRDGVTTPRSLSSLLPFEKRGIREEVSKKETTVVVEGRAAKNVSRGTRLEPSSVPSSDDLNFARTMGLNDERIKQVWAEFVDYWIGIPGSRGTKLNWSATWRNRVRQISGTTGASNGYRGPRPLQDDSKSISAAAGRLAEAAERGEYTFGPRPSLLPDPNEAPVFLLSKG